MTANYFTLAATVRELRPMLIGAKFVEAYSHRANELRIKFDRGTLVAVLRPINGALFFSGSNEQRPKANIQLFFAELEGKSVTDLTISETDREVRIDIADCTLRLQFFGSPNALLDRADEVIASYKKAAASLSQSSGGSRLGKRYGREAAVRGITSEALEAELLNARNAYVYERSDDVLLSLVPLSSVEGEQRAFPSVNEAVRYTVIERGKRERVAAIRRELLARLERDIERLERSRSEMRKGSEDSNRPERYAAFANAILMHAHEIERGSESAEVAIVEEHVRVALDPTLSAYENAASYFERSKRAKASREELKVRAKTITEDLAKLRAERDTVLSAESYDELQKLKRSPKATGAAPAALPFRQYVVAGGLTVLVGKNAKQNDELTLHVAKKEDIWLHARGVPGSHVVLQVAGRKQVPKEAILQAAEIAAYHSDAKTQQHAPVSYTQKKYVRKPKGANPGAVIVEREEVVMVTPRVPE